MFPLCFLFLDEWKHYFNECPFLGVQQNNKTLPRAGTSHTSMKFYFATARAQQLQISGSEHRRTVAALDDRGKKPGRGAEVY